MMNKKKIWFFTIGIVVFAFIGLIILFGLVKNKLSLITNVEKNIDLITSLKDINENFLTEYNVNSQRSLDVLHYNISIELLQEQRKIKGDVTLKIKVVNPNEDKITLNFYDNLKINSVFLDTKEAKYDRTKTNISIYPVNKISDTLYVRLIYEGEPKSLGFGSFNFDEINGRKLIYTLNEPVFASTWFPCVDLPDDKAMADIYITNDSSFVSLSNGKLIGSTLNGSKRTYHWKTYYPISTYLIAIYSGFYKSYSQKYVSISKDTVALYCYALPEKFEDAVRDFKGHEKYLKIFEEIFGSYPFAKEKYSITQFNWSYGAMEHQTITGIGTNFISGRKLFQDMMIHELAHQWWGNAVGPKTWKDIWLNEGFSTYSEALYWEKQSGYDALKTTLMAKVNSFNNGTLYNPLSNLFSSLVYDKGAWVLHMLRKEVGDSTFFKIIRNYYDRFKYKNASTRDFQKIAQEISKKNLNDFFDQWVFKGTGIIEANFDYYTEKTNNNLYSTRITIKQLQNGYDIYKFPIEIKIVYDNQNEIRNFYITKREEIFTFESIKKPVEIIVDPNKWLLANFETNKLNDDR